MNKNEEQRVVSVKGSALTPKPVKKKINTTKKLKGYSMEVKGWQSMCTSCVSKDTSYSHGIRHYLTNDVPAKTRMEVTFMTCFMTVLEFCALTFTNPCPVTVEIQGRNFLPFLVSTTTWIWTWHCIKETGMKNRRDLHIRWRRSFPL